jgi:COG4 transport protein
MSKLSKKDLQAELKKLVQAESAFDSDLRQYFSALADGKSLQAHAKSFDSSDLGNSIKKIEEFSPCFEAMINDSKKLANQVEDCRCLSDRLSIIVRRLDIMQIRAHEALACAQDVMNLKDFKSKIVAAMEQGKLPLAVSYIRQVHDVDLQAAKASDDYGAIQQAEREVKFMVQSEFSKAIDESNISGVMSLCPLLQTLGLEEEARDAFLAFVEKTVFIAVSADASAVDDATDPATGYAQALLNVFNNTYMILQRYLPMVIQGMENSLGDVHFIRRLHAKCEQESGLVLKRYMKYRHIKNTIAAMKSTNAAKPILPSDIHVILDELALLIQSCCMYSKYLKQLADGADKRKRSATSSASSLLVGTGDGQGQGQGPGAAPLVVQQSAAVVVFSGPTDFDKMVDELINRYCTAPFKLCVPCLSVCTYVRLSVCLSVCLTVFEAAAIE